MKSNPTSERVVGPPAAFDINAGPLRVELQRRAQAQRVFAVAGALLEGDDAFLPVALAAAEVEQIGGLPGLEAARFLEVADEHHLLARQAEARGDLHVGEAHRLALALDLGPVEAPHRVA